MSKLLGVKNHDQKRPFRPFTAYNIFFHLEKERVLQGQGGGYAAKIKTIQPIDQNLDSGAALRPARYQNLVLPAEWYVPDPDKKRRMATKKNRDPPHRIITFVELSKMISSEWKVIDDETKTYCKGLADEQLRLYNEEMKVFVAKYGVEAAKKLPKSKSNQNKMTTKTEKPTKRAVEGVGRAEGKVETEAAVEAGYFKLTDDIPQAKDQDIWEITAETTNWTESFHQDKDRNESQNDACNKQIDFTSLDIEPEPMSSKVCDNTMCYWANQFANDGKMCSSFDFDKHLDCPNFRSQNTSLSKHMQPTPIDKQEVPTANKMMLSYASTSGRCQGFETEEYYDQTRIDARDLEQGIDFDMKGFDWNWDPDPFSKAADAHVPNEQSILSLPALNGQESPSRAHHMQSRYFERCLSCSTCSCSKSAAFQNYGGLYDYRPI